MNNPFDYTPDAACDKAFRELTARIEALRSSRKPEDINFCRELDAGKMLGILIASDNCGARHTLLAFSGQIGNGGFHYPGFVGPVFDYLDPDGHFKTKEAEISRMNAEIALFQDNDLRRANDACERMRQRLDAEVAAFRDTCRQSKLERDARRAAGNLTAAENDAMLRASQFEKAELRRLKKRAADALEPFEAGLREAQRHLDAMKEKRRSESEALQQWLFTNFRLLNARGEEKSLSDIFAHTATCVPPSGAGECCAPKLLQAAFLQGWHPEAMAEYWYGRPKGGEVRIHGHHYPACRGKCLPVLGWMLQGLATEPPLDSGHDSVDVGEPEIIFENSLFCVVDKPSGMLSVPGKGAAVSVQQWLQQKYGTERQVKMAHRLDQDTSGLLVATFGPGPFKTMQSLFATRRVKKTYISVLEGDYESRGIPAQGRIDLPLSPDWLDRPRQLADPDGGKDAVTDYAFTGVADGCSRVTFSPLTGRTHQLRVHAASQAGLGMPIVGDRLYGDNSSGPPRRLHLHAFRIEFTFPADGRLYRFESPVPF